MARRDDLLAIAGGIALALKRAGRDGLAATITFGSRPGTTCDFLCLALIGDSVETLMIDAGGRTRLMRDHELVVEVGAREAADFARVSLEAR
ncbi:MAG: hypothetical protein HZY79_02565 [Rhodoblastus sp.]|nr:MAG: hypothetical protein HZY79_02565 [Rhodoblastus sp.]